MCPHFCPYSNMMPGVLTFPDYEPLSRTDADKPHFVVTLYGHRKEWCKIEEMLLAKKIRFFALLSCLERR